MLPLSVHYSGSGGEADGEMMEGGGLDRRATDGEKKTFSFLKAERESEPKDLGVGIVQQVPRNKSPCHDGIALYWPLF